jgi:hypothetical protein
MQGLAAILVSLAGPIARQVLLSLGIGLITFAGLDAAVTAALSAAKSSLGQISGPSLAIMARGGVFTAMSVIAGGITAGISMIVLKRFGKVT